MKAFLELKKKGYKIVIYLLSIFRQIRISTNLTL